MVDIRRRNVVAAQELMPDFLTVEEAAKVLRIGRTAAYGLTRQWRATSGAVGLPVVRFGRQLRVPRAALEAFAGGPISTGSTVDEGEELHSSETHRVEVAASRYSEDLAATQQLALFDLI
jgi:excisionase family DNA binding protein